MAVYEQYGPGVETAVKPFGHALVALARRRPDVVGLTADLAKYTDIDLFAAEFPERYFQVGMAEQNLVGVAAGLARVGYVPFLTSYCTFLTRRAYDFIAIALAEGHLNAKVIAALPGLTTSYGSTHQGIEDLALMRAVPGLVVLDLCDATDIEQAVAAIAEHEGPVYARILRGRVKRVLDPKTYQFEIGKAKRLRAGKDVLLVSTGVMTDRALQAADLLEQDGIAAGILHVPTVKPLDAATIVEATRDAGALVTLENHTLIGGLGAAVTDLLYMEGVVVPTAKLGLPDVFVECGSVPFLTHKYGLTVDHVVEAAKEVAGRKRKG